jgi:hypothetical protein
MIRVLVIIAVAGFLVSVVTLSAAVGIAGPDAIIHGAWSWDSNGWGGGRWRDDRHGHWGHAWRSDDGPQTTRDLVWPGSDTLSVDLSADVHYAQGPGPAKMTVSGPQDAVADVVIENGRIRYKNDHDDDAHLTIVVTAPSVVRFEMESSGKLAIANYRQDRLDLDLEGDADVTAAGEAKAVQLTISGSADADLAALKAQSAKVEIEGSGDATLAPTDAAEVSISGSGDVTLLTHPAKLQSRISGSGRIRQADGAKG